MIKNKTTRKSKDVWSATWQKYQDNPQLIIKKTSITKGFPDECYQLIKKSITIKTKQVLEVGCGTGRFVIQLAQDFPGISFEGSDISKESISLAQAGAKLRNINNITFYVDDMTNLHPKYKSYDLVFNEGSVEHFRGNEDLGVLKKMYEFVAPGGNLVFGVPNYRCYVHTIHKALAFGFYMYGFERSYKKEHLNKYLSILGLSEKKVTGLGFSHGMTRYGFPYNLLAKKYEKLKFTNPDRANEWNDKYGFFIFASGVKPI